MNKNNDWVCVNYGDTFRTYKHSPTGVVLERFPLDRTWLISVFSKALVHLGDLTEHEAKVAALAEAYDWCRDMKDKLGAAIDKETTTA